MELPKNISINKYAIMLIEGEQPPYRPIYAFSPVKLEILKAYIKTNLKTGFIQPSKSFASASILFDKKLNGSLCLCINEYDFYNLSIKYRYLLTLISKIFNWLS